jgi:OmpA-OmpF porin, OOP family
LLASTAFGQNAVPRTGLFVGAEGGPSDLERFATTYVLLGGSGSGSRSDDSSIAYKLRIGYRLSRYFTLEAGYANLGSFSSELFVPCVAHGTLPIGERFYLSATVGGFFRHAESTSVIGSEPPGHASDSGTVGQYGIGLGFPLTERFEITLDWMRTGDISFEYEDVATFGSNGGEVTIISAGARFIF